MEVPFCATCGHHHESGVRCSVCGHVGRSQIFDKMKTKAAEKMKKRVIFYANFDVAANVTQTSGWAEDILKLDAETIDLLTVLKDTAFGDVNNVGYMDGLESTMTAYAVYKEGDAYGGALRLRFPSNTDGVVERIIIDSAHVLPRYRNHKTLYILLYSALNFISFVSHSTPVTSLRMQFNTLSMIVSQSSLPTSGWICGKLERNGFRLAANVLGNDLMYDIGINAQVLLEMMNFIRTKL